jgi:uncharacterized protein YuzE
MIRTSYDPDADVFSVQFGAPDAVYDNSQEVAPGVYVEFDTAGNPIGVEITSVRLGQSAQAAAAKAAAE